MAETPNYVRLTEHLAANGSATDVNTGFSVGGYDVVEVPTEDQKVVNWVTAKIRENVLEPATQSDYEKVHPSDTTTGPDVEYKTTVEVPYQEQHLLTQHQKDHKELLKDRKESKDEEHEPQGGQVPIENEDELVIVTDDPAPPKKSKSGKDEDSGRERSSTGTTPPARPTQLPAN